MTEAEEIERLQNLKLCKSTMEQCFSKLDGLEMWLGEVQKILGYEPPKEELHALRRKLRGRLADLVQEINATDDRLFQIWKQRQENVNEEE